MLTATASRFLFGWRMTIGAAAIVGLALNTVVYDTVSDSLMSFTQQTNLMIAAYFPWLALRSVRRDPVEGTDAFLRGAVTLYILITGLVYNVILADGWASYGLGDTLAHVVVPSAALVDWIFVGAGQAPVRSWYPLAWLGYLVGYLVAVLVRGGMTGRYPYFFLDAHEVGTSGVVAYVGCFLVGFTVLGYLIVSVGWLRGGGRGVAGEE